MTRQEHDVPTEVDALVLGYLSRQAREVDADAGLARVRAALGRRPPRQPSRAPRRSRLALLAAVAAAILVAFLSGLHLGPAQASSRDLVQQTRQVHQLPMERCYAVEIRRIGQLEQEEPLRGRMPRQVRVWTRGDQFWVEMKQPEEKPPFVWGREKDGSLWAALDSHRGVRVPAAEAPRALTILADVYSLNVDTLLDSVLHDCTLTEEPEAADRSWTRVVRAEPRSNRTRLWLDHATLEIDTEAKVLRRLVIARNRLGTPFTEVVYTLTSTRPAQGDNYGLESRLREPRQIHQGKIEPRIKLELVAKWLGARGKGLPRERAARPRDVAFEDVAGNKQTPLRQTEQKATVLLFLLPDCPISNAYAPEIKRICAEYTPKKVAAFVVHADPDVSREDAQKHAREYGLPCPVLLDPTHVLVKHTGVKRAPEVAVLDPKGKVVYRGRIDDLYADFGKRRFEPAQRDLRNALDAILAGKPVPVAETEAVGCYLPEPKK